MANCERCQQPFTPLEPGMDQLCPTCVENLIEERRKVSPNKESEADQILQNTLECLEEGSEVQALLESPGVGLALARMVAITTDHKDLTMLALNSFRVGAYLAFKQARVNRIIGGY